MPETSHVECRGLVKRLPSGGRMLTILDGIDPQVDAAFESGEILTFRHHDEVQKHHAVQIWQTPYTGHEFAAPAQADSFLFHGAEASARWGLSGVHRFSVHRGTSFCYVCGSPSGDRAMFTGGEQERGSPRARWPSSTYETSRQRYGLYLASVVRRPDEPFIHHHL